jgi:hypothetical protein
MVERLLLSSSFLEDEVGCGPEHSLLLSYAVGEVKLIAAKELAHLLVSSCKCSQSSRLIGMVSFGVRQKLMDQLIGFHLGNSSSSVHFCTFRRHLLEFLFLKCIRLY